MTDEIQDLEAEIAELTRELDESPAGAREDEIQQMLERLTTRLRALRQERDRSR